MRLPEQERQTFVLHIGNLPVGELSCSDGHWTFKYTPQFKARSEEFYPIVGFPDLEKTYESDSLWPFFLVRIPGLGQPEVKETIAKENLDVTNEAQLLRRFGERTLANPFVLMMEPVDKTYFQKKLSPLINRGWNGHRHGLHPLSLHLNGVGVKDAQCQDVD